MLAEYSESELFVGLSGGMDSTSLLTLVVQAFPQRRITVIHVNHGLSKNALAWAQHSKRLAAELGCDFVSKEIIAQPQGKGLEAAARDARYTVFDDELPDNSVLLLGQHLDDQVETFLMRLFRGSGLHGLQAMQPVLARKHYRIMRPLLGLTQENVVTIAQALKLSWVEDESNADVVFDRNYLRHEIMPLIEARWPQAGAKIASLATHLQHSNSTGVPSKEPLPISTFEGLSEVDVLSRLHQWLTSLGVQVPSRTRLKAVYDHVVNARVDAAPQVEFEQGSVRRFKSALYWVPTMTAIGKPPSVMVDQLSGWAGVGRVGLVTKKSGSNRIQADLPNLHWRIRQGGESLRLLGRDKTRDLKRLFQEINHLPWLRERTPLLYSGDHLIAVGDLFIATNYAACSGESGLGIVWQIA